MSSDKRPHIVLVIPRGEAVRNFLFSDTLPVLSEHARITLLSVIHDDAFRQQFGQYVERIEPLQEYAEKPIVERLRKLISEAHFRWLWSEVAKNRWEVWDHRSTSSGEVWDPRDKTSPPRHILAFQKALYSILGNRPSLRALTALENHFTYAQRPTRRFDDLYAELKPDLVFNGSHIHGKAGFLPIRVAHRMGIPTAGFIFSWDNLTSRSRIMEPYDDYLVWHTNMRDQLRGIYPEIAPDKVHVTGTPQLDYHLKDEYRWSCDQLFAHLGLDPRRKLILYTTGVAELFPYEPDHVDFVIDALMQMPEAERPQLVVRVYAKDGSGRFDEHKQRYAGSRDVFFPQSTWNEQWMMPTLEDNFVYTNLIRHADLGINAASTVSLELCIHDVPVINIGYDPPGRTIPHPYRWHRHIEFDHYHPVAESGAVMVAYSNEEMRSMIHRALQSPNELTDKRRAFLSSFFGSTLDGCSGDRVARTLLTLAHRERA
jgi:hypothetical protein